MCVAFKKELRKNWGKGNGEESDSDIYFLQILVRINKHLFFYKVDHVDILTSCT